MTRLTKVHTIVLAGKPYALYPKNGRPGYWVVRYTENADGRLTLYPVNQAQRLAIAENPAAEREAVLAALRTDPVGPEG